MSFNFTAFVILVAPLAVHMLTVNNINTSCRASNDNVRLRSIQEVSRSMKCCVAEVTSKYPGNEWGFSAANSVSGDLFQKLTADSLFGTEHRSAHDIRELHTGEIIAYALYPAGHVVLHSASSELYREKALQII